MKIVKVIAISLVFTASASTHAAVNTCSAVKDPQKRLKCFDAGQKSEIPPDPQGAIQQDAAEAALKALRKLRSTAQMGLSLRDYSQVILEQVPAIDENLRLISNAELKALIEKSKNSYLDARSIWSGMIQLRSPDIFVSVYKPIYSKYQIDPKYSALLESGKGSIAIELGPKYLVSPMWQAASSALSEAEQILATAK